MSKTILVKYPSWNKMMINGDWKEGSSENYYTVKNPYNEGALAEIKLANQKDIDEAYQAAYDAQTDWEFTTPDQKVIILEKVIQLLHKKKDEIVDLLIEETGSTRLKASAEVDLTIADLKQSSTFPFKMKGEMVPSTVPGKENRLYRIAEGVVSIITPWNWPLLLAMRAIGPALATGNSVVIKPDLQTPITGGLLIAQLFEEAGLPKGLLNVIVADIAEVGDSFVEHPVPRVISFTGSTAAGKHIGKIAGQNIKKAALELGGNNAFIVLDDADVEQAVSAALFGKFLHHGQICMSINRIIVDRKIYPIFVNRFIERVKGFIVGDPTDENTTIGPLINRKQVEKILKLVTQSIEQGATLALEGNVSGNMLEPFVLTEVTNDMAIAQEEIFGPVAVIIPVENEEEAVKAANDTPYGLTGSVFSGSIDRGIRVANRIKTGMIHVNDSTINAETNTPFGGVKNSGLGRYHGDLLTLEEFTTIKWVSVQHQPRQFPY
jgi:acyl-CoA reductase-like NAD-dependent aldehyde dehydrogenase